MGMLSTGIPKSSHTLVPGSTGLLAQLSPADPTSPTAALVQALSPSVISNPVPQSPDFGIVPPGPTTAGSLV